MSDFDPDQWAAGVKRMAELNTLDSLGVRESLKVGDEIKRIVGRWGVMDEVCVRIARAIVENQISATRVGQLIEAIIVRRRRPKDDKYYPRNPGAFFVVSIKKEFAKLGVEWRPAERQE